LAERGEITNACEFNFAASGRAAKGFMGNTVPPKPGDPNKKADPCEARLLLRHCRLVVQRRGGEIFEPASALLNSWAP
jgi:hypothetical protein